MKYSFARRAKYCKDLVENVRSRTVRAESAKKVRDRRWIVSGTRDRPSSDHDIEFKAMISSLWNFEVGALVSLL